MDKIFAASGYVFDPDATSEEEEDLPVHVAAVEKKEAEGADREDSTEMKVAAAALKGIEEAKQAATKVNEDHSIVLPLGITSSSDTSAITSERGE